MSKAPTPWLAGWHASRMDEDRDVSRKFLFRAARFPLHLWVWVWVGLRFQVRVWVLLQIPLMLSLRCVRGI